MTQDTRIRRIAASAVVAVVLGLAAAAPAAAGSSAPTATQLVKKLVREGLCTHLEVVDGAGHEVKCGTSVDLRLPIRIYAYATRGPLRKTLQREVDDTCALAGKLPSDAGLNSFRLVVGRTWFVTAEPILRNKIVKHIGGTVKTFTCPTSEPSSLPAADSLPVD